MPEIFEAMGIKNDSNKELFPKQKKNRHNIKITPKNVIIILSLLSFCLLITAICLIVKVHNFESINSPEEFNNKNNSDYSYDKRRSNNIFDYSNYLPYSSNSITFYKSKNEILTREEIKNDISIIPCVNHDSNFNSIFGYQFKFFNYGDNYRIIEKKVDNIFLETSMIPEIGFLLIKPDNITIKQTLNSETYGQAALAEMHMTLGYNNKTGLYNNVLRENVFITPLAYAFLNSKKTNDKGCLVYVLFNMNESEIKECIFYGDNTAEFILSEAKNSIIVKGFGFY